MTDIGGQKAGDILRPNRFENLAQADGKPLLPTCGTKVLVYEEYAVLTNAQRKAGVTLGNLGDRRIIYDVANDLYYFTANIHLKSPIYTQVIP